MHTITHPENCETHMRNASSIRIFLLLLLRSQFTDEYIYILKLNYQPNRKTILILVCESVLGATRSIAYIYIYICFSAAHKQRPGQAVSPSRYISYIDIFSAHARRTFIVYMWRCSCMLYMLRRLSGGDRCVCFCFLILFSSFVLLFV